MKYLLLHNLDILSKNKILQGYLTEGYHILSENDDNILLKLGEEEIEDEDTYVKLTFSLIKRNTMIQESIGKVIDLTEAFLYAKKKGKYDGFNNKFDWYIRNTILKEI